MAIPRECKRLAEVDFPIARVGKNATREKATPKGHPAMLHLWWARRPLASSRAVLMALLLPDPCDPACPTEFKEKARAALPRTLTGVGPKDEDLRETLLGFIAEFSDWDAGNKPANVSVARALVVAAHGSEKPVVADPFAGGGSIPLEALRIGCEAIASDLNPVACLILKSLLEDIPASDPRQLAAEVREIGKAVQETVAKELRTYYPRGPEGDRPIAYLWARTVRCESPNCGAEIPLVKSFWLAKKGKTKRALQPIIDAKHDPPRIDFAITEPKDDNAVHGGTVSRAKATCLVCGATLAADRVRIQLADRHGGGAVEFSADGVRAGGARLLAVVGVKEGVKGRLYRTPNSTDYAAVRFAQARTPKKIGELTSRHQSAAGPEPDALFQFGSTALTPLASFSLAVKSLRSKRCAKSLRTMA